MPTSMSMYYAKNVENLNLYTFDEEEFNARLGLKAKFLLLDLWYVKGIGKVQILNHLKRHKIQIPIVDVVITRLIILAMLEMLAT
jgi:hypothetical protein